MKKGNFFTKNWILLLVIVYILSPLDLLPDTIPVLGSLDDIMLLVVELIRRYRANQVAEGEVTKIEEKKEG